MKPVNSIALAAALALLPVVGLAQYTSSSGTSQQAGQVGPSATPIATATAAATPVATPVASSTPSAQPATVQTMTGGLGTFLTDSQGRSLYVFLADSPNVSNCSGACASVWPPLTIPAGQTPTGSGDVQNSLLGTIQRSDGTTQVTYAGRPLYLYAGDTAAGTTNGEGLNQFGAEWYLVKPDGTNLEPAGS